jgi:hypothetical protein
MTAEEFEDFEEKFKEWVARHHGARIVLEVRTPKDGQDFVIKELSFGIIGAGTTDSMLIGLLAALKRAVDSAPPENRHSPLYRFCRDMGELAIDAYIPDLKKLSKTPRIPKSRLRPKPDRMSLVMEEVAPTRKVKKIKRLKKELI